MQKLFKKRVSLILVFTLILQFFIITDYSPVLLATEESEIDYALHKTISYCNSNINKFTDSHGEWLRLALEWADEHNSYIDNNVPAANASDDARKIMSGIAARNDVSSHISKLQNMQNINEGSFTSPDGTATLNQTIWPIIALNMARKNGYSVNYNSEEAVAYIVYNQDISGGFDESGYGVDVDSTAHALIALAPYRQDNAAVNNAVNNALEYLQMNQDDNGAFLSWGSPNSDSTAAVIEALIALGEPLQGAPWKGDMVAALLSFQNSDGSFFYSASYTDPSLMSTYHALLALSDLAKKKSKYQNSFKQPDKVYLEVNTPSSLTLDSDARINVVVNNRHSSPVEALLIFALYDKGTVEKMINYTYLQTELPTGAEYRAGSGFTIPADGDYEVRLYLWDNWETKTPLMSPAIIPVE